MTALADGFGAQDLQFARKRAISRSVRLVFSILKSMRAPIDQDVCHQLDPSSSQLSGGARGAAEGLHGRLCAAALGGEAREQAGACIRPRPSSRLHVSAQSIGSRYDWANLDAVLLGMACELTNVTTT